jgi:hypothetical protein
MILTQYMPEGNEDIHENPVRIGASLGLDLKSDLNDRQVCLILFLSVTVEPSEQKPSSVCHLSALCISVD